ncbi:conserved hypothetical protein [delta proteobacterium NaphS2]|nr:conserved hypothetical protein [delta proteobacterium NaphS2]
MIFGTKENIATLEDILGSSWRALHQGVRNARHPFHRPTLATMDRDKPQVRTVILRDFLDGIGFSERSCSSNSAQFITSRFLDAKETEHIVRKRVLSV